MGKKTKEKILKLEEKENNLKMSFSLYDKKGIKLKNGISYNVFLEYLKLNEANKYTIAFVNEFKEFSNRDVDLWKLKCKSEKNAIIDLINFMFVKYKYPKFFNNFFFNSFYKVATIKYDNLAIQNRNIRAYGLNYQTSFNKADREFFNWFLCLTSGKSLYKEYFQYYGLSKRETFLFSTCNVEYVHTAQHALLYALLYSSLSDNNRKDEIKKFFDLINKSKKLPGLFSDSFNNNFYDNTYYRNIIKFLCKYDYEEVKEGFFEYIDFLLYKKNDETFSLKNRTLNSIKQLSNEWHIEMSYRKEFNSDVRWEALFPGDILWKDPGFDPEKEYDQWKIVELLSANALIKEGKRQRHCVGGYVDRCVSGKTHIFSLSRSGCNITIEVSDYGYSRSVVQARKKLNVLPNNEEKSVIKRWCKDKKIHYSC